MALDGRTRCQAREQTLCNKVVNNYRIFEGNVEDVLGQHQVVVRHLSLNFFFRSF